MTGRLAIILVILLSATACGVKNDLVLPDGKATPKNEKNPSQPPSPIGR